MKYISICLIALLSLSCGNMQAQNTAKKMAKERIAALMKKQTEAKEGKRKMLMRSIDQKPEPDSIYYISNDQLYQKEICTYYKDGYDKIVQTYTQEYDGTWSAYQRVTTKTIDGSPCEEYSYGNEDGEWIPDQRLTYHDGEKYYFLAEDYVDSKWTPDFDYVGSYDENGRLISEITYGFDEEGQKIELKKNEFIYNEQGQLAIEKNTTEDGVFELTYSYSDTAPQQVATSTIDGLPYRQETYKEEDGSETTLIYVDNIKVESYTSNALSDDYIEIELIEYSDDGQVIEYGYRNDVDIQGNTYIMTMSLYDTENPEAGWQFISKEVREYDEDQLLKFTKYDYADGAWQIDEYTTYDYTDMSDLCNVKTIGNEGNILSQQVYFYSYQPTGIKERIRQTDHSTITDFQGRHLFNNSKNLKSGQVYIIDGKKILVK